MLPNSTFHLGDKVIMSSFVDCFGVYHPESELLTVTQVTLVQCEIIPSYFRLYAIGEHCQWEASERFFTKGAFESQSKI